MYVQDQLGLNPGLWAPNPGHPPLSHDNLRNRAEISQLAEVQRDTEAQGARSGGQRSLLGHLGY